MNGKELQYVGIGRGGAGICHHGAWLRDKYGDVTMSHRNPELFPGSSSFKASSTAPEQVRSVSRGHPHNKNSGCVLQTPQHRHQGVCHVRAGSPARGALLQRGHPKATPPGSWCCPWCQTLFLPAKSSCNAHTRVFVHAGDHALACARAACMAGERHTGGPSSHAGARGVTPHHASGERGDKPTENQAVGRQGWMPMHSTTTPCKRIFSNDPALRNKSPREL